jgi:pre-mRNA-splicing factor SYF1
VPVQQRVFKAIKLWSFYIDLEESIGDVESTKAVYDRVLDLKIVTPQLIVNYAMFLEEHQYFEESFKVLFVLICTLSRGQGKGMLIQKFD